MQQFTVPHDSNGLQRDFTQFFYCLNVICKTGFRRSWHQHMQTLFLATIFHQERRLQGVWVIREPSAIQVLIPQLGAPIKHYKTYSRVLMFRT